MQESSENIVIKKCGKCDQDKLLFKDFYRHKRSPDGFTTICKNCSTAYDKVYKKENREKVLQWKKESHRRNIQTAIEYRRKNRKKLKENMKQYARAHRAEIREKRRKNRQERKNLGLPSEDFGRYKRTKERKPNLIIHSRLSSRLGSALRKEGIKKTLKTLELLGCSIDFLKEWLVNQFTQDMTWEAFMEGKIHIEHKIPCCCFFLKDIEEQKKCFHYTNLRPMWGADNSAKVTEDVALRSFRDLLSRDMDYFLS